MKKLFLAFALVAFAVAVQAGDSKTCQDKTACCSKTKAAEQTKTGCCAAAGKMVTKSAPKPLHSPKAAAEVASK